MFPSGDSASIRLTKLVATLLSIAVVGVCVYFVKAIVQLLGRVDIGAVAGNLMPGDWQGPAVVRIAGK